MQYVSRCQFQCLFNILIKTLQQLSKYFKFLIKSAAAGIWVFILFFGNPPTLNFKPIFVHFIFHRLDFKLHKNKRIFNFDDVIDKGAIATRCANFINIRLDRFWSKTSTNSTIRPTPYLNPVRVMSRDLNRMFFGTNVGLFPKTIITQHSYLSIC